MAHLNHISTNLIYNGLRDYVRHVTRLAWSGESVRAAVSFHRRVRERLA